MDSNDFWCRAFLAAMGDEYSANVRWENHGAPAAYCEQAADAALAVAQRRGRVAGEREANAIEFVRLPGSDMWKVTSGPEDLIGVEVLAGRETYPLSGCRTLRVAWSGARVHGRLEARPVEASIERSLAVVAEAPAPKLERVEFTAERGDHGLWNLSALELGGGVSVLAGSTVTSTPDGATIRIKWGESSPPKPIEVWIERAVAAK